jgi:hypothetical protein
MKKLIFGLAFIGSITMFSTAIKAQGVGGGGNSYGGVCCLSELDCEHPKYGLVAESTWTPDISFCP